MRRRLVAAVLILLFGPLSSVLAEGLGVNVLIVELQTAGATSGTATHEFVKLYNPGAAEVDITGWKLQYRAASKLPADPWPATSATTIACAPGAAADCTLKLGGHQYVTLATSALGLLEAPVLNGGFADAGGQIRLVDSLGFVNDFVGYGTAVDFELAAAVKPGASESLKRKVTLDGQYTDTNNNSVDFTVSCGAPSPTEFRIPVGAAPGGCALFELPEPEVPTEPPATDPTPSEEPPADPEPPIEEPTEPGTEPPVETPPLPEPLPEPTPTAEPPVEPLPELPPVEPEQPPTEPAPVYLPLVITEVFPDPASPQTDSADEFVELYNPGVEPVDLTGYTLKTGTTFEHTVALPTATVAPGEYVLVTSAGTTLSLVNTGTAIKLVDPLGVALDEAPNYQQAIAGQSWVKNTTNWEWTTTPTAGAANVFELPLPPEEVPPVVEEPTMPEGLPEEPQPEPGQGSGPVVYLPILITELLPDPASPSQDSTDEFIELFNPNTEPVNLKDYQLQSGSDYRYKYVLPELTIGPGQYLVFMSEESGLNLSNSGTQVRLLDPNGQTVDELANYGKSVEGQSWSKAATGEWQWSTTATPAAANLVSLPPAKATKATAASKKKTTVAKAAPKPKVASASKSATTAEDEAYEEPAAPPPNYWLLAGVGSMALSYGLYEYRQGISQAVRKVWLVARGKSPEL